MGRGRKSVRNSLPTWTRFHGLVIRLSVWRGQRPFVVRLQGLSHGRLLGCSTDVSRWVAGGQRSLEQNDPNLCTYKKEKEKKGLLFLSGRSAAQATFVELFFGAFLCIANRELSSKSVGSDVTRTRHPARPPRLTRLPKLVESVKP